MSEEDTPSKNLPPEKIAAAADGAASGRMPLKTCPFCDERIQNSAVVCRYCGRRVLPESFQGSRIEADGRTYLDHVAAAEGHLRAIRRYLAVAIILAVLFALWQGCTTLP